MVKSGVELKIKQLRQQKQSDQNSMMEAHRQERQVKQKEELQAQLDAIKDHHEVRDPTTWPILQHDGPNHLGLLYNALPDHQMALITSVCVRQTAKREMIGSVGAAAKERQRSKVADVLAELEEDKATAVEVLAPATACALVAVGPLELNKLCSALVVCRTRPSC